MGRMTSQILKIENVRILRHGTCVAVHTKRRDTDILCGVMNFMLLENFTKVHLGQLRATFSSLFCVTGVGRSIITSFKYIYIYIVPLSLSTISRLLEGGNAIGVRHS